MGLWNLRLSGLEVPGYYYRTDSCSAKLTKLAQRLSDLACAAFAMDYYLKGQGT